tara:strand:+ start:746 stop:1273 length:528 start_codon:yes stop_codon:yes gene_type:complete
MRDAPAFGFAGFLEQSARRGKPVPKRHACLRRPSRVSLRAVFGRTSDMKHFFFTLIAALGLAGIAAADPIEGVWQTEVDEGSYALVTIAPCGGAYCGTISKTFNASGEYQSPNLGKQIVRNMVPQDGTEYRGQVWRPSNDKVYLGKIALSGNQMALRGCVAGGLICARQNWVKIR